MRNTVHNVGRVGLIKDIKPHLLPSEYWTDVRNVRFSPQKLELMGGVEFARGKAGVISAGLFSSPTTDFIIYSTGGKVYAWDGNTEADITRVAGGDYGDDFDNQFEVLGFNGFAILNNGVDLPQMWGGTFVGGEMVTLPNWNVNWTAKKIRRFKSFLIALDITESGTRFTHKMRWSTPAEPGAVPSTWDDSNAAAEAGSFDFTDVDKGNLVDGLELGERFFVYKEGSIWAFDYVGGRSILSRTLLKDNIGLSVPRSLVNLPYFGESRAAVQFFVGDDNFYIMDGIRTVPIWNDVFRNEILKVTNPDLWKSRSFSVVNYKNNELWFCVPEVGAQHCTLAFVMNYQNGSYTIRELSGASTIVSGIGYSASTGNQLDLIPYSDGTFFSDGTGFFSTAEVEATSVILETSPDNDAMYYLDLGEADYDGTPYTGYVEREALATIKNDSRNEKADIVDYNKRKLLTSITPKLHEGSVALEVGTQERENSEIAWVDFGIVDYDQYKFHFPYPVSGRFLSFKFTSVPEQKFAIGGFDYEIAVLGEY